MTETLDTLVSLLSLERIEENLFRGNSQDLGFPQLFGGQVIGQALSAASQTVVPERHVHSMHGYFLRPGDSHQPVVYDVDRVRDGGSFSTRRVSAIQKGQTIFTCSASFQADETGFEHQLPMASSTSCRCPMWRGRRTCSANGSCCTSWNPWCLSAWRKSCAGPSPSRFAR